jgi:hypothetical protein
MMKPLNVWFQKTGTTLHRAMLNSSAIYHMATTPEEADCIIFEDDKPAYIRQTEEFKNWPQKCLVISETDLPAYFLPGCYASNKRSFLSRKRGQTIPYLISYRSIPNPFINTIGKNAAPRYLYSFRGGSTSWVRKKLFKYKPVADDVYVEESNHYHHWSFQGTYLEQKSELQKQYATLLGDSAFFLCPKGAGVGSVRLFEVIQAGRVPVIISDDWVPVEGVNWDKFSVRIPESKIKNIDSIVRRYAGKAEAMSASALQAWHQYFEPEKDMELLWAALNKIQAERDENRERFIRSLFPLIESRDVLKEKALRVAKTIIFKGYKLMGREFPYSLNRPIAEQLDKK